MGSVEAGSRLGSEAGGSCFVDAAAGSALSPNETLRGSFEGDALAGVDDALGALAAPGAKLGAAALIPALRACCVA